MAKSYFSAEILEVGDGMELEGGGFVLNIDTCHKAETILGEEEIEPRLTLFGRKARQAVYDLYEGAKVVFIGAKRNPRSWISPNSGKRIEQVEIIAEGFKVVKAEEFDATVEKIKDAGRMFDVDDLEFTSADRDELAKETAAIDKDETADVDI